jgi:hypothetical protein
MWRDIDLMGIGGSRDLHRLPDPVPHRIDFATSKAKPNVVMF